MLDDDFAYVVGLGLVRLAEGWLVMFDLRKELPWSDKLFVREVEHAAKRIRIVGC